MSLFQKPAPLSSKSFHVPPRPNVKPTPGIHKWQSMGAIPRTDLPLRASIISNQSTRSDPTIPGELVELDAGGIHSARSDSASYSEPIELDAQQTGNSYKPYTRPRVHSLDPIPSHNQAAPTVHHGTTPPPPYTRHRGLSQLFVYEPRTVQDTEGGNQTSSAADDKTYFELEVPITINTKAATDDKNQAVPDPVPSSAGSNAQYSPLGVSAKKSPSSPSGMGASLGRDLADSAAWHRKSKLFQVPGHGIAPE